MNEDYLLERIGIVDGLTAKRRKKEVTSLEAKVRFDTELESSNEWSSEPITDTVLINLPPGVDVNPGDLVHLSLRVTKPFGQRFVPALEMGDPEPQVIPKERREARDVGNGYFCETTGCTSDASWSYPDRQLPHDRYLCDLHDQAQWQTDEDGELIEVQPDWAAFPESRKDFISEDEDFATKGTYMLPRNPTLPAVCDECDRWAIDGDGKFSYWCRLHVPVEEVDES